MNACLILFVPIRVRVGRGCRRGFLVWIAPAVAFLIVERKGYFPYSIHRGEYGTHRICLRVEGADRWLASRAGRAGRAELSCGSYSPLTMSELILVNAFPIWRCAGLCFPCCGNLRLLWHPEFSTATTF